MKTKRLKRILILLLCLLVVAVFCSAFAFDVTLAGHHCEHDEPCQQCMVLHNLQQFFAALGFTTAAVTALGGCHYLLWRLMRPRNAAQSITPVALQVRLDI